MLHYLVDLAVLDAMQLPNSELWEVHETIIYKLNCKIIALDNNFSDVACAMIHIVNSD